jgi:hypothetical protein
VTTPAAFTPAGNGAEVLATINSPAHRPSAGPVLPDAGVGRADQHPGQRHTNGTIVIGRPSGGASSPPAAPLDGDAPGQPPAPPDLGQGTLTGLLRLWLGADRQPRR